MTFIDLNLVDVSNLYDVKEMVYGFDMYPILMGYNCIYTIGAHCFPFFPQSTDSSNLMEI